MIKVRLSAFTDEAADSLAGQIDAMKRNGIEYTELRSIDKINVSKMTNVQAIEYKKQLDDNGIKVWSLGSPLGKEKISLDFEAYKDMVRHTCELAKIFETDKIRVFSFFEAYDERDKVMSFLSEMVEIAREYGVTLYHENESKIYGDTAERVCDIKNTVKGLNYIYDPANYLQVGEDSAKTLSLLHASAGYFHIKDVNVKTGEIVPAGYGNGNIPRLVSMLDCDTTFSVEPHLYFPNSKQKTEDKDRMFSFKNQSEAFDAAISAIKNILALEGFTAVNGSYVKLNP